MINIWHAIIAGAIAGGVVAFMIGPVFFVLIQTSIRKGVKHALSFAGGIVSSDAIFFLGALAGLSFLSKGSQMEYYMAMGGGVFLSGYGVALMLKKVDAQKDAQVDIHLNDKSYLKSYFNGFVINSLNPAVIPLWAGVIIKMQRNLSSDKSIVITFFISLMLTIFITDISKALLAFRLKSFITNKVIWWMNKSIGTIMLIAGGRMLYTIIK